MGFKCYLCMPHMVAQSLLSNSSSECGVGATIIISQSPFMYDIIIVSLRTASV